MKVIPDPHTIFDEHIQTFLEENQIRITSIHVTWHKIGTMDGKDHSKIREISIITERGM